MRLYSDCPDLIVQSHKRRFALRAAIEGAWTLVMFHPAAYTPVCSTEVVRLSQLRAECPFPLKAISIIPDKLSVAQNWIAQLNARTRTGVQHDCVSDREFVLSRAFGFDEGHLETENLRGYFIFDPRARLRSFSILPKEVGFSSFEIIRVISALVATDSSDGLAPVDWTPGDQLLDYAV